MVEIEGMNDATTLLEKSDLVVAALSKGLVSVEDAEKFLGTLQIYSKVIEVHELEKRIEQLENNNKIA